MSAKLPIIRHSGDLRQIAQQWRRRGHKVALVPTMGSLHEGHLSLIRLAKKNASRVIVSVFVNPTQFAPNEDYSAYPRNEERDWRALLGVQPNLMYVPGVEEMYPADFATRVEVAGLTQTLEGITRPHFFAGVTTVVAKLFLQSSPDMAVFGEKDYQQLQVIKQMVRDMGFPITILPGPIMRESDGLAMSSRNVYLDERERAVAPQLYAILRDVTADLCSGRPVRESLTQGKVRLEHAGFRFDYLELRDSESLMPIDDTTRGAARLLAAVYLGKVRLIDNIEVA